MTVLTPSVILAGAASREPEALPPLPPLCPDAIEVERIAGCRALAGISACHVGSQHPVVDALIAAEMDVRKSAAAQAAFDKLPAIKRRRIVSTFAAIMSPSRRRGGGS